MYVYNLQDRALRGRTPTAKKEEDDLILELTLLAQLILNPFTVGGAVPITPASLKLAEEVHASGTYAGVAESTTVPSTVLAQLDNQLKAYQMIQRSA